MKFGNKYSYLILIFLSLLFIVNYSFAIPPEIYEEKTKNPEDARNKGITAVSSVVYDYINHSYVKRKFLSSLFEYDSEGNLLEKKLFYPSGETSRHEIYKYDAKSRLVLMKILGDDESVINEENYTYTVDDNGNIVLKEIRNSDGYVIGKVTFKYNSINKIEFEENFNSSGNLQSKIEYQYNSNGKPTAVIEYIANGGNLMVLRKKEFNSLGYNTKTTMYNQDGAIFWICDMAYDSNGNLKESIGKTFNGKSLWRFTQSFDTKNILIEKTLYDENNVPYELTKYNYDFIEISSNTMK